MRKVKTYLKSFWQSVKDKPFVFIIFMISIMFSVVVSAYAYRLTKNEVKNFRNIAYYDLAYTPDFDEVKFYNTIKECDIVGVDQSYSINETFVNEEGEEQTKVTFFQNEYLSSEAGFSLEELDSGTNIAIISNDYCFEEKKSIGDNIIVFGQIFKVVEISEEANRIVRIPATANIVLEKNEYSEVRLHFNTQGNMNRKTAKALKLAGFDIILDTPAINGGAVLGVSIGLLLICLAGINVFVANKFIADKNSKRYSLYRIVGAKNRDVAAVMIFESLFVVVIAFCLGVVAEHFAIKPALKTDAYSTLVAADYVALFFINAFSVIVTTGIVIFKKLYSAPMNSKQRGNQ